MRGRWWTTQEIARLLKWRGENPPVPTAECARRLGRTPVAVRTQLKRRLGATRTNRPAKLTLPLVRRYVRVGRTDAWIGLKLGRARRTVVDYRRLLGLAANENRNFRDRPRCDGCNRMSPIPVGTGWKELTGWVSRRTAESYTEVYCKKCFAEHGWVDGEYRGVKADAADPEPQCTRVYRHPECV